MILPIDSARACRRISLDSRQLGLSREEGIIVDYENMKQWVFTFGKQKICNNGLAMLS